MIGILRGGPHSGSRIEIDPRRHHCAVVGGHWYFRVLSADAIKYKSSADYEHSAKCCTGRSSDSPHD